MHTRCCSPPESCGGQVIGTLFEADAFERLQRFIFVVML